MKMKKAKPLDYRTALRFATAFVELYTGNGAQENPPKWPRTPDGEPDPEAIAKACRASLNARGGYTKADLYADLLVERQELHDTLYDLMQYVGGWDDPTTHPCGRAAALLKRLEAAGYVPVEPARNT